MLDFSLGVDLGSAGIERRGGGAAWTPAQLPNLALWLDASDLSTISSTGPLVDQWRDKSGNLNHAAGSLTERFATGVATQNALNAMQLANGNRMTLTAGLTSSDITIVSVVRVDAGGGASGQTIMANSSSTPPLFGFATAQLTWDAFLFFANNGSVCNIYGTTRTAANAESLYVGTSTTPVATGSFASNGNNFTQLGQYGGLAAYNFAGIHCEHVVVAGIISTPNLALLMNYLKPKWGTP